MAPYDSDSSGGEDNDYTETNVLLGYASKEPSDDTISHLGGRPTWLNPTIPPSAAFAKCKICNDLMVLLLQLNGDLPEHFPGHERRLYVFTCRRKTCRRKEGSVRALRGTKVSEPNSGKKEKVVNKKEVEAKPVVRLGESLFGVKPSEGNGDGPKNPFAVGGGIGRNTVNPFGTSSASTIPNPFAPAGEAKPKPAEEKLESTSELPKTFASALNLNNTPTAAPKAHGPQPPPEPWPQDPTSSELQQAYPLYYLVDADYETLDKIEELEIPVPTMDLDESTGGSSSGGGKEDKDVYESSIDKTFQKFADRLAQNPEQVLRYEFKGNPLLYSKVDGVGKLLSSSSAGSNQKVQVSGGGNGSGIPRCGNCGGGRVFEVQLTPHAILELEREEEGLDGMEWGTVILGVCERDCVGDWVGGGEVGYVEEWVGVQWEELNVGR